MSLYSFPNFIWMLFTFWYTNLLVTTFIKYVGSQMNKLLHPGNFYLLKQDSYKGLLPYLSIFRSKTELLSFLDEISLLNSTFINHNLGFPWIIVKRLPTAQVLTSQQQTLLFQWTLKYFFETLNLCTLTLLMFK